MEFLGFLLPVVALILLGAMVVTVVAAARAWVLGKGTGFGEPGVWHGTPGGGESPPLDAHGAGLVHPHPTSPPHDGGFNHSTNAPSFDGGSVGGGDFGGGSFGGGDCGGGSGCG